MSHERLSAARDRAASPATGGDAARRSRRAAAGAASVAGPTGAASGAGEASDGAATEGRILAVLAALAPGRTACPGEVAHALGTTQRALRPAYARLAEAGRIVVTQRGAARDLATLRGPYRLALARVGRVAERDTPTAK